MRPGESDRLRRFLVPHDGSALSSRSAETLGPLLAADTQVTLLHVDDGDGVNEVALAAAEKVLRARGADVTRRIVESGDAAGAILDVAGELRPDLVAMTTHGRSGVERLVRGSVAERVLRRCPVPVWMTNPFTAGGASNLDSLLVTLDGSQLSAEVLDSVLPLATAFGSRVVLLHVDFPVATDTASAAAKRREIRRAEVEEWLEAPRERVASAGLEVAVEVAFGNVAEEVLRLARPGAHDLLAMTTHGRSGPGRWLLGSSAELLLRQCRLPVLLHRVGREPGGTSPPGGEGGSA